MAAWRTFFSGATEAASDALALWTNGEVTMSLGDIQETTLAEVASLLKLSDDPSTIVQLGVDGECCGQLILTFDDTNARALVRSIIKSPQVSSVGWSPLEISAFAETGNIMASVYLNQLSALTKRRLWPTPPEVTCDYAISVVEQALLYQAMHSDRVLMFETCFECHGQPVQWNLVFVPSPELLAAIEESLHTAPQN